MTFDTAGNYYIADEQNDAVRKVDIYGVITTVAGTGGVAGFSGDGGLATSAKMNWTKDVAFDKNGNMYITDCNNDRIRKVNTGGIISTYVGIGTPGYNGDGILATTAEISNPECIAIYANSLYIADQKNNRIRKVNLGTGIITTVAGTGVAGFSGDGGLATSAKINAPYGVAFDNQGNMYIGDQNNYCVREVANGTGIISTATGMGGVRGFAGDGGLATNAQMAEVAGIAVGKTGNIYIADTPNNRIRKVDKLSGIITTIVGTGTPGFSGDGRTAISAEIYLPGGVTLHDTCGDFYFPDWGNQRVREVVGGDVPLTITGKPFICPSVADTLVASGGTTYKWSNGATTSSIIVSPALTATYSVSIFNSCSEIIDTNIKITVLLAPSVTLSGKNIICVGTPTTIGATGGGAYKWSIGATTSSIIVSPATNTTYSLTVTDNGCFKDTSITVYVSTLTATITAPFSICQGDTITLNASGGGTYQWNTGSSTSSISVITSSTTMYSVVITNGPCSKDTGVMVIVNPSPNANIAGNNQVCKGDSIILIATGGGTYTWNTNQTSDSITLTPSSTSVYTVVVSNSFGCKANAIFQVNVTSPVDSITGPSVLCFGDSITLSAIGGGYYQWNTGATTSSIEIDTIKNTIYYVSNICHDTARKSIFFDDNALPLYACCDTTITLPGIPVVLNASGRIHYYWTPSIGINCDSCPNPIVTPTITTTYTVIGTDSAGCQLVRTITVDVLDCLSLSIPNVFTPNGDGINDELVIDAQSFSGYSIEIYNRWGKEMYHSDDPNLYWDGKNQNDHDFVSAGVYYYIIKYSCSNKSYNKDGYVQVIR